MKDLTHIKCTFKDYRATLLPDLGRLRDTETCGTKMVGFNNFLKAQGSATRLPISCPHRPLPGAAEVVQSARKIQLSEELLKNHRSKSTGSIGDEME